MANIFAENGNLDAQLSNKTKIYTNAPKSTKWQSLEVETKSTKIGKKLTKIETNRVQEAIPSLEQSYLRPRWSLGGRGETTITTKKTSARYLTRPWAKGPANYN